MSSFFNTVVLRIVCWAIIFINRLSVMVKTPQSDGLFHLVRTNSTKKSRLWCTIQFMQLTRTTKRSINFVLPFTWPGSLATELQAWLLMLEVIPKPPWTFPVQEVSPWWVKLSGISQAKIPKVGYGLERVNGLWRWLITHEWARPIPLASKITWCVSHSKIIVCPRPLMGEWVPIHKNTILDVSLEVFNVSSLGFKEIIMALNTWRSLLNT